MFREDRSILNERLRPPVREYEVMRIVATIPGSVAEATKNTARREILKWTSKRSGSLPNEAWTGESFESFARGRTTVGVRVNTTVSDIWALRTDDPDKSIAGRIWTTEIIIGSLPNEAPRLSTRLFLSGSEIEPLIEPHTPGFIQQLVEVCGLSVGGKSLLSHAWRIQDKNDVDSLVNLLFTPARVLPVFALSIADGENEPFIDVKRLVHATLGLALVVVVSSSMAWTLTDRLGRGKSVFGGAARVYMPGFAEDANPYAHRLELADRMATAHGAKQARRWMQVLAADYSIRRLVIGHDVPTFASIRSAFSKINQERLRTSGASKSSQLDAANQRIEKLELQIHESQQIQDYFQSEHQSMEERANAAEDQLRAARYRIHELSSRFNLRNEFSEPEGQQPTTWPELVGWCDNNFSGKVVLGPAARRALRAPAYDNLALTVRCLQWLLTTCRNWRLNGGEGSLRDAIVEEGVYNTSCGGDEYSTSWEGRNYIVDWHIKNGGNTRDPRRCLRIYYFWEPVSEQIVIADMPGHRSTSAS